MRHSEMDTCSSGTFCPPESAVIAMRTRAQRTSTVQQWCTYIQHLPVVHCMTKEPCFLRYARCFRPVQDNECRRLQPGSKVVVLVKWPDRQEQKYYDAEIVSADFQQHGAGG
jgi:hypothetical protein